MTSKEKKGLSEWLTLFNRKDDRDDLQGIWRLTDSYKADYQPDVERAFTRFQQDLQKDNPTTGLHVATRRSRGIWQIAAVITLVLAVGFAIKSYLSSPDITYQTIATDSADQRDLDLADGSKIYLNTASSITYPEQFVAAERAVEITGEVFFEVAEDPEKPFIINTGQITIKVLGTSFNVRSYPDEDFVEVFVKTGKVAVTVNTANERHILTSSDKLILPRRDGKVIVEKDPAGNALAWKSGVLNFKSERIGEIFNAIERLFDVKIEADNTGLRDCYFTIKLNADKLSETFSGLEAACDLKISSNGEKSFVVRGECCK